MLDRDTGEGTSALFSQGIKVDSVYLRSSMGSFEGYQTGRSAPAILQRSTAGSRRAVEMNDRRIDRSISPSFPSFSFPFRDTYFSSR